MARLEGKKANTFVIIVGALVFAAAAAGLFWVLKPAPDTASNSANAALQNQVSSSPALQNSDAGGGGSSTPIPLATAAIGTTPAISGAGSDAANTASGAESATQSATSTGNQGGGQASALPSATPVSTAAVAIATAAPSPMATQMSTAMPGATPMGTIALPNNPLTNGAMPGNAGRLRATPMAPSSGGNMVSGPNGTASGTNNGIARPPLTRPTSPASSSTGDQTSPSVSY